MNCTFYAIVKISHKCLNMLGKKKFSLINLRLWTRKKNSFITFNAQVNELNHRKCEMCGIEAALSF